MNFEITHWGIPGDGADVDDPYPDNYVIIPLVGVVWGVERSRALTDVSRLPLEQDGFRALTEISRGPAPAHRAG